MKGYVRPAGHKQGWIENIRRNKALYLFVLPAVIEVLIFNYIPMYGIQIAFRNFKPAKGIWGSQWVGLKWFSRFFASSQSTTVIWNTVILSIELLAVSFPLSILFALLVNQYRNECFRKVVQTVSYAPHFISTVVMCGMIVLFLSPSQGLYGHICNLIGVKPGNPMERSVRRAMVICLLTGILCLGFAGVLSYLLSSSISRRSQKLLQSMDSASAEDFRPVDTPVAHDEIGELTVHFNAMRQRLKELIEDVYLLQLRQKNMELERVCGELKYLQAQLDPHFLFNTLNGMLVLCVRNGYADLAEVVRALSRLMRRMLDTRRDRVPLGEEISFVRMVLQIERFRFGDKLTYEIDIDESLLDYTVPMISVQGLVENACKHGVQPQSGPGIIRIFAGREAKMLRVTVQDNGIGMTGEQLEQLRQNLVSEEPSAGGVGLQNLYRRLKLLYGEDARLNIDAKELQGTTVSFIIPLEREEEHVSGAAGR